MEIGQVGDRIIMNMSREEARGISEFIDFAYDFIQDFEPSKVPEQDEPIRKFMNHLLPVLNNPTTSK